MPEEKTFGGVRMLVATKEENLARLQKQPFFIATIDYYATGEGVTRFLLAKRAESETAFRAWATGKTSSYWMIGATVYINQLPPKNDPVLVSLGSKFLVKHWADIIDGETESGAYYYFAEFHMNLS